jgi:hypothetical protein
MRCQLSLQCLDAPGQEHEILAGLSFTGGKLLLEGLDALGQCPEDVIGVVHRCLQPGDFCVEPRDRAIHPSALPSVLGLRLLLKQASHLVA